MSFLSRKPARPDGRGRGDGYDDYADDGYADDGYAQGDDDGWSPNEYFSPEGIKGKWAGETPAGRSGGRGQRGAGDDSGRNSYGNDFNAPGYGGAGSPGGAGYGDEIESGLYDLPDGADDDRGDRRRSRRSKDREDRGERTGILRLRRDRGEDIWPDDGISDEDYWASVAADRPLNVTDSPADSGFAAPGPRSGAGSRPGTDPRAGADSRFGTDQRGGERGGAGRLGAPPGLAADYPPGAGSPGAPGQARRTGSGPIPARPGTGPHPVRPKTGPTPTVGVTSSRPPAGPNGARPGPAKSGPGSGGFPQSPVRPSFQPNIGRSGGMPRAVPGGGRQQDWGERTERIERVNASGYPEPRPSGRGQGPGPAGGSGASGPLGLGTGSSGRSPSGPLGAPVPSRGDNPAWRAPERQAPGPRVPGGDRGHEVSGPWPAAPARGGGPARGDDDPLTSTAYSRAAMAETDGRSYRVAARRSQSQAKLTEQTETFIGSQYQQHPQAQQGRGGEYWQYRDDGHAPVPQSPGGWHAAPGDQRGHQPQSGRGQAGPGQAGPGQAGPGQAGPAAVPGRAAQPAFTPGNPGRPGAPGPGAAAGSGLPGGQYEAQRRPAQPQLPGAGLPAAGPSAAAGHSANGPADGRAGLNPYDCAVTGSYPYSSQPYPAHPASGGPAQNGAGAQYHRPATTGGYPVDGYPGGDQGRPGQGRAGYGGYPAPADRRY